jgi:hypothetical protein
MPGIGYRRDVSLSVLVCVEGIPNSYPSNLSAERKESPNAKRPVRSIINARIRSNFLQESQRNPFSI